MHCWGGIISVIIITAVRDSRGAADHGVEEEAIEEEAIEEEAIEEEAIEGCDSLLVMASAAADHLTADAAPELLFYTIASSRLRRVATSASSTCLLVSR